METRRIYIPSMGRPEILENETLNSTFNKLKNLGFNIVIVTNIKEYDLYCDTAKKNNVKAGIIWSKACTPSLLRLFIVRHALCAKLEKIIIADDNLILNHRYKSKGKLKNKPMEYLQVHDLINNIFKELDLTPQIAISSKEESFKLPSKNTIKNYSCTKFTGYKLDVFRNNIEFCRLRTLDYIDINLQLLVQGFENKVFLNYYFTESNVGLDIRTKRARIKDKAQCAEVLRSLHPELVSIDIEKIIKRGSYKIKKHVSINWEKAFNYNKQRKAV